ncbi:DUF998 domain-containing protein [Spirosoma arcticum]
MIVSIIYLLATLYLLVGIIYFAHHRSDYSHVRHTISELGETESADSRLVSLGLFLPTGGILLLVSLFLYQRASEEIDPVLGGLSACVGIGYIVAAFFPCDKGSPLSGTTRQQIHNLGGFVEYAGGAFFLIQAADRLPGSWFDTIGYTVLAGAVLLSVQALFPWRGMIQRVAESWLFGTLIVLSLPQ